MKQTIVRQTAMKHTGNTLALILVLTVALVTLIGCAGSAKRTTAPPRHPEELSDGKVNCLDCHDDQLTGTLKPYGTFRHTNSFLLEHGALGAQSVDLCNSCHSEPFCMECHATTENLAPSLKRGDRPDRSLPHRGEYLTRHQIDGRVDPGSCIKCHGNRNDGSCAVCH
jgi:hypothetical protein